MKPQASFSKKISRSSHEVGQLDRIGSIEKQLTEKWTSDCLPASEYTSVIELLKEVFNILNTSEASEEIRSTVRKLLKTNPNLYNVNLKVTTKYCEKLSRKKS